MRIRWFVLFLLSVFFSAAVFSKQVKAGLDWEFRDGWGYTATYVCRDGALVIAGHPGNPYNNRRHVGFGAFLYTEDVPPPDENGDLPVPPENYGPALGSIILLDMENYRKPLPVDYEQDGSFDDNLYVYGLRYLPWPQILEVGAGAPPILLVQYGEGGTPAESGIYGDVEDCFLQQEPTADSITIGPERLGVRDRILGPEALLYRLDEEPQQGDLRLNGWWLQPGFFFTQADVNNGLLTYTPHETGSAGLPQADSFVFSVAGTVKVSTGLNGLPANDDSSSPALAAAADRIVFDSWADNLVNNDDNTVSDVFLTERAVGAQTITAVSVAGVPGMNLGNSVSSFPAISADGDHILFVSNASNLVPGDGNAVDDLFVHSAASNSLVRVSVSSDGEAGNDIPVYFDIGSDGRFVVFDSWATNLAEGDTNAWLDVFLHDRNSDEDGRYDEPGGIETIRISNGMVGEANDLSFGPAISDNGRYIAYASLADNLVPGDTNLAYDVFVFDRIVKNTVRISLTAGGAEADGDSYLPDISANGRFITFVSLAGNLVAGDDNGEADIYLVDRDSDGDGLFDEPGGTAVERISVPHEAALPVCVYSLAATNPAISADGRYVAFSATACNLIEDDFNENYFINAEDIFVYDRVLAEMTRVSVGEDTREGDERSFSPSISADGRYVAFYSAASNFVPADTNMSADVFLHFLGYTGEHQIIQKSYLPAMSR